MQVYSEELAEWATLWAAECNWYHGSVEGTPSGQGQNLWLGYNDPSTEGPINAWYSEVKYYDYETKTCKDDLNPERTVSCGHYTQVSVAGKKFRRFLL